jgi:hypothetical protein
MKSKYVMICLLCFITATHTWRDYKPQIKNHIVQSFNKNKQQQHNASFLLHQQSFATVIK